MREDDWSEWEDDWSEREDGWSEREDGWSEWEDDWSEREDDCKLNAEHKATIPWSYYQKDMNTCS